MSSIVNEVRVEDGFTKANFAGLELIIHEQRGFINATQLCLFKGKQVSRYNETQQCKNLKLVLTNYYGICAEKVKQNAKLDNCVLGWYFHPALFLDLAIWLSPEIYVNSAVITNTFFNRTDQRKCKLRSLFAFEETPTYENNLPNCRIRYESLDLLVNDIAWFKTSDFCRANMKKVRDFEARKDVVSLVEHFRTRGLLHETHYHPLLFLRLAAWVNLDFYVKCARIVFCCNYVRLNALFRSQITAAGVSFSVRSVLSVHQPTRGTAAAGSSSNVQVTVAPSQSMTNGLAAAGASVVRSAVAIDLSTNVNSTVAPIQSTTNGPAAARALSSVRSGVAPVRSKNNRPTAANVSSSARSAVAPARSTTNGTVTNGCSSSVQSAVAPDRSTSNSGTRPIEPSTPSTSSGQAALPTPNLNSVIWIENDEDSDDSIMTTDMNTEANSMMTRSAHEKELARVRRELERAVERERLEKESALAREREKEAVLTRVEEEKRAAIERERSKDDQLEALRRQLEDIQISDGGRERRKRSHAETRANAAATIVNEVGVAGLECLVLFVSTENAVYGFRRQFQNIIPAIHKQLDKVTMFVAWFVTNNAVLDYNRCKAIVSEKAKKNGCQVRLLQNQMELDNEEGREFDLPDTIRTTLRIDLEVIEADVKILGRLFRKPVYRDDNDVDSQRPAPSSTFLGRVHKWIEDEHASFMGIVERREQRRNQAIRR